MTTQTKTTIFLFLILIMLTIIPLFFDLSLSMEYFEDNSFRIIISGCLPYGYCS